MADDQIAARIDRHDRIGLPVVHLVIGVNERILPSPENRTTRPIDSVPQSDLTVPQSKERVEEVASCFQATRYNERGNWILT